MIFGKANIIRNLVIFLYQLSFHISYLIYFLHDIGIDGVPLPFVVKFIKLAFSYEQWEVFEALLQPFMTLLKTHAQMVQTPAYIISLQLLAAMEPFFNTAGRKQAKKSMHDNTGNENSHGMSIGWCIYSREQYRK